MYLEKKEAEEALNASLNVAISRDKILERVNELAEEINDHYGKEEYVIIAVLKGCLYFLSDLTKKLAKNVVIDFMAISSYYGPEKTSSNLKVVLDVNTVLTGKKVLIVEDIYDSGETISRIKEMIGLREPKEVRIVSLLWKKNEQRKRDVEIDWVGFEVENKFVIGYGLDYKNDYRNLESIYYLETPGEN